MMTIPKLQTCIAATVLLSLATVSINVVIRRTNNIIPTTISWQEDLIQRTLSLPDPNNAQLSRQLTHNTKGLGNRLDPTSENYGLLVRKRRRALQGIKIRALRREKKRGLHVHEEEVAESDSDSDSDDLEPQTICDRPMGNVGTVQDFNMQRSQASCPELTHKRMIVISGKKAYGRTGNNLVEFLHSLQYAHDKDVTVGIMANSWAIQFLLKMWMAIPQDDDGEWIQKFEEAFCVKIFLTNAQIEEEGWDVVWNAGSCALFRYHTDATEDEYMKNMGEQLRTLWSHYNTGDGVDRAGKPVHDMCSAIDAVFGNGNEQRADAVYSTIHARSLEGSAGFFLLNEVARNSGCDPVAALNMEPDYIKSILEPLGMLDYPIVLITDGQDNHIVERLRADPVIGPKLHLVPEEASWIGGDITLAMMSNVFIGNPASTFSGFIARSRLAMGFGHNFLFRAKNEAGEWESVCGDECIYDRKVMSSKKLSY